MLRRRKNEEILSVIESMLLLPLALQLFECRYYHSTYDGLHYEYYSEPHVEDERIYYLERDPRTIIENNEEILKHYTRSLGSILLQRSAQIMLTLLTLFDLMKLLIRIIPRKRYEERAILYEEKTVNLTVMQSTAMPTLSKRFREGKMNC